MSTSTSVPGDKKITSNSSFKEQDDVSVINVPMRTTSLSGAIFNLTKSAVGAGTVFLPDIFYTLGLKIALPLLLSGALFCSISLYFLGRMAHHCETGDYFKLGRLALGRHGETAVSVSLLLFLIGVLIAYANLTGSYVSAAIGTIRNVDAEKTLLSAGNITLIASTFFIFPLSCMRDMSMLAKTSILGMVSMLYISGLLAYDALTHGTAIGIPSAVERGTDVMKTTAFEFGFSLCGFVGNLILAFVNHFTIVSLVPVMKDPSAKSRLSLITASTVAATVIYLLASLGGFYRFGSLTRGTDALSVFKAAGQAIPLPYTIAQIALGFVLICSFPLLCDPARSCLDSLIFGNSSSVSAVTRHYLETGLIVAVPTAVAFFLKDQANGFLSLFSGFCGSLLVFSFPGAFFLILSRRFKYSVTSTEKALAYFCVVLGVVLAILSTVVNVSKLYTSITSQPRV